MLSWQKLGSLEVMPRVWCGGEQLGLNSARRALKLGRFQVFTRLSDLPSIAFSKCEVFCPNLSRYPPLSFGNTYLTLELLGRNLCDTS